MPLYEYKCQTCGQVFEVIQKFSDAPLKTHDGCGGAVERLVSGSAFHFKGSGWYVTDYAKNKTSNGGGGSKKTEAPPAASKPAPASTSSDSKS